ncbi:MAG: type I-C CRISPR-associated endonuclease Cas1 [Armatimonadetes bacterium]|nr:type I-C CRISPR-associated endonuclease Cas1 [Armatimonadota bacterium]
MKHLLNTLYVMSQETYLALDGETVLLRREGQSVHQVPLHTLDGIIAFGQVSASPALMAACAERNVTLSFMSLNGRFQARVQGPVSGNVLLRRAQYRLADDLLGAAAIAQSIVMAKLANGRAVLLRASRDHPHSPGAAEVKAVAAFLGGCLEGLAEPLPLDELRGLEGEAGKAYFSVFDHLIVAQKESFFFEKRSRRPPLDNVNALLSFAYSLLAHDVCSALEGVGLDPQVGFLHRDRPGRPSLALDLMEELRPVLADRLVLSLINRQQVRPKGFSVLESGAVRMDDDTRRTLITAYQERKRETLQHPFLQEQVPVGLLPHCQALLLARFLRGDLDAYPPFFWR